MKGRLRPRFEGDTWRCWQKGHRGCTLLGVFGGCSGTFKSSLFDEYVGGSKLILRGLAQHADREPEGGMASRHPSFEGLET